jgi:hypothetical membrane protein
VTLENTHVKTSARSAGVQPLATRLLLAGGAIGPLSFIVTFLILGATRPHYSAWQIPVSSLSIGNAGWTQRGNFMVFGALMLGFAIGLRRVLRTGRGSTWGPILFGIWGLCLIGAGIFVTDPGLGYPPGASTATTVHGILHSNISLVGFTSLTAACFVLARRDATDPAQRGWAWYSVATGLLFPALFVLTAVAVVQGGPAGLLERIFVVVGLSWIVVLAIRLMSKKVPFARA